MPRPTRVILVTDGDEVARAAVEAAAKRLGLRVISSSAGNPTPLSGREIVRRCLQVPSDPVVVMVDDRGRAYKGKGERAAEVVARHPRIRVLGALAVASNTGKVEGTHVDASVTASGRVVQAPVDKEGRPAPGQAVLLGDTVDVLEQLGIPVIIGIGDLGKMGGADFLEQGAPVTERAIREILRRAAQALSQ